MQSARTASVDLPLAHHVVTDEASSSSSSVDGLGDASRSELHVHQSLLNHGHQEVAATATHPSLLDQDERPLNSSADASNQTKSLSDSPVTWSSLPQKSQLAVLTLARLSEPLSERSLAAYMFYQLEWFDSSLPESTIASQGGMLTAAFAAAQFVTAVWWGRAADTPWIGRKRVLLVGLFGTCVSSIGIGFSRTFAQALFFRAMAGALNGNAGVMRTMISEIIKERKYQSRAFLLLPMCFNVGVVIGPILGGFLADPIASFPHVFGPGSAIGGKNGVAWMTSFPYALPNIISGMLILVSALGVVFGLDETHEALRHKPDYGRKVGKFLASVITRQHQHHRPQSYRYTHVDDQDALESTAIALEEQQHQQPPPPPVLSPSHSPTHQTPQDTAQPPPPQHRSIFTRPILLTLLTHHLLALHISTFNALIFLLLPAPRSTTPPHLPFLFTGGLGLPTTHVGLATAIIGVLGLPLQLLLYPRLTTALGTLPCYRLFLPCSIAAYTLLPFVTLLPRYHPYAVWPTLTGVLALQVLARTFALPSAVILVNNSAPSARVLGTVHGVAQSVSCAARTVGPVVGGWVLGWGLRSNCVGAVWWGMAGVAGVNWVLLWSLVEGDGRGGKG